MAVSEARFDCGFNGVGRLNDNRFYRRSPYSRADIDGFDWRLCFAFAYRGCLDWLFIVFIPTHIVYYYVIMLHTRPKSIQTSHSL